MQTAEFKTIAAGLQITGFITAAMAIAIISAGCMQAAPPAAAKHTAAINMDDLEIPQFYQQQIEKNRMSDLRVRVLDADGKPAACVKVRAEMQRHSFMFGTAIAAKAIVDPAQETYRQTVTSLFNTVVMENSHKWKMWEKLSWRTRTDEALKWALDNNLRLRGHTLIWQTLKYGCPMPKDIEAVIRDDSRSKADIQRLKDRVDSHIRSEANQLATIAEHIDVVNEHVENQELTKLLTPDAPLESSALVDWYKLTKQLAPNAKLYVNDYHILVGEKSQHKNDYETQIKYMLENGAPVDGIGFQCHYYNYKLTRDRKQLWQTLERFGKLGPKLCITEFDTFGGGWGNGLEARQENMAIFMHRLLTTFFAHPKAEGFLVWGFWDGRHWAKDAPFYNMDWTPKPALEVYKNLVFKQWWSDESSTTGEDGCCKFRVFNGDYKITVTSGDKSFVFDAVAAPDSGELTVTLPGK